jgi:hypothetical protein
VLVPDDACLTVLVRRVLATECDQRDHADSEMLARRTWPFGIGKCDMNVLQACASTARRQGRIVLRARLETLLDSDGDGVGATTREFTVADGR